MGYKHQKKIYNLIFQDEEFNGLEVKATSLSLGRMLKIADLSLNNNDTVNAADTRELFETFSKALVSWNLEDEDGNPVPTTLDGILSQDQDLIMKVIEAWSTAVAGVSPPLNQQSSAGNRFQEDSIPMEIS